MKLDFSAKIPDQNDKPIDDGGKELTLGGVSCTALLATFPDEQNLTPDKKVARFQLALLAAKGGEQDVTPEQFTELKGLIGKAFGPLIVGRAYEILDAAAK